MKPLIIFKTGSTFACLSDSIGDFEHWISAGLGQVAFPVKVIDPRQTDALPAPEQCLAAIITGSHSMVSDREPWSEHLASWLQQALALALPILGICYGHQLLAHAMGGTVDYHPDGLEIGTVAIQLTHNASSDQLFQALPPSFPAQVTHCQTVRHLPETAVLLARNDFEPHHAFRIGTCAWGVQFHPEFSPQAMQVYIEQRSLSPDSRAALLDGIASTPAARSLLRKFAELLMQPIS